MKKKSETSTGARNSSIPEQGYGEEEMTEEAQRPMKKHRRALRVFLRACLILASAVLVCAALVFLYAGYTRTHYEITFYQETSKKVSRNLRLVVLSDIHNREYGKDNETLISDVKALNPDLVLFAGDMINSWSDDYEPALRLIRSLSAEFPCYGVMGNHENQRIYQSGDTRLPGLLEEAGLILLRNRSENITVGTDKIQLIGVEGTSGGFEEYGGRAAMDNTPIDPGAYCIVMTHIPILFDHQLSDYKFDLGIAGHTHGGLVNLPHFGGLYSDEEGFFPTYYAGKYTLEQQQSLLISRGLGDSRSIPRINNMPELMVIDINWF